MQVQINTDKHIVNNAELRERVQAIVDKELKYLSPHLTRVELYLSDINSGKSASNDKRCLAEGRLSGLQPFSAEHKADDIYLAITESVRQLHRVLSKAVEKANSHM